MNILADEYQDQVVIARFELMKPYSVVTAPELKKQYDIAFFPTVIFFMNGKTIDRWVMNYDINNYRRALNAYIGLDNKE